MTDSHKHLRMPMLSLGFGLTHIHAQGDRSTVRGRAEPRCQANILVNTPAKGGNKRLPSQIGDRNWQLPSGVCLGNVNDRTFSTPQSTCQPRWTFLLSGFPVGYRDSMICIRSFDCPCIADSHLKMLFYPSKKATGQGYPNPLSIRRRTSPFNELLIMAEQSSFQGRPICSCLIHR